MDSAQHEHEHELEREHEHLTADDIRLMRALAQRVTALRPDLVNSDASPGELAWNWGREHRLHSAAWRRRLWHRGGELAAWAWVRLPHTVRMSDGSDVDLSGALLVYQTHPDHAELVDEVIDWYGAVADGLPRLVRPRAADTFALERWTAHGYRTDPGSLGDSGYWTQLTARDLAEIETPSLPDGFTFRTAEEAGPEAAVRAHLDAWAPSSYSAEAYEGVRRTEGYHPDLHLLVRAPDGTMAASALMWPDEANHTIQFEPVGTHPAYRRRGLGRALLLHSMRLARETGATRATVACLGAPGHPGAQGLYGAVGFTPFTRDAPLLG